MDCVGLRLKEGKPFPVCVDMTLFFKAYYIPRRPAFPTPVPWWSVDIMRAEGGREQTVTLWEGGQLEVEVPRGTYYLRYGGLVKATPHELNIHACLLLRTQNRLYPLRRSRMACVEYGALRDGTIPEKGEVLDLSGLRSPFLYFQPTDIVVGVGTAEVTIETSPDKENWEPLGLGGFPDKKMIIDQNDPGVVSAPVVLAGNVHRYIRWAYHPTNVLGWGARGNFYFEYDSIHQGATR